jgi:transposase-like protein
MYAETRAQAERGIEAFVAEFSPKYERAVDCLIKDSEALLAFFDFPAEPGLHGRNAFGRYRMNTGSICARATPSSRASRPCGSVSA